MSIPHSTFSISIPQLMKVSKYLLERTHTHAFEYYQEQIPLRNVTRLKVGKQGILQIHNNCLTDANKRGYIDKSRYLMLSCGAMGHQLMVNGKQAQWKEDLYESQGQQVRRGELIPDQFLVNFGHTYRNLKTNLTYLLCTISSSTHSLPHHHIWFFFLFCLFSLSYLILIPFHTASLYPHLSLSLLILIPISTASLLPTSVLHLFPHLPVLSILFASYPFFHSLSLMPSCSDFHYFLSCHLSLFLSSPTT